MRSIAALCVSLLLPACTFMPGLDSPKFTLSPRIHLDVHRGEARMQSLQGAMVVDNAPQTMDQLGQNGRDEDWAIVATAGDGFSGLELEYRHIAIEDTSTGILGANYGSVPVGTEVSADLRLDSWRLAYFGEVLGHRFETSNGQEIDVKLAAGVALAHRDGDFEVSEDGNTGVLETVHFSDDGVPYLGLRGRVEWNQLSFDIDWLYSPDISFGGDFTGNLKDFAVIGRYHLEAQDVTLLAGFRWMDVDASGDESGLRYDTDFAVEGFVLGVEFDF